MKKIAFILPLALALFACNGTSTSGENQQDSISADSLKTEVAHIDYHGTIPAADAAVAYDVHLTLNYQGEGTYCERQTPQDGTNKGITETVEGIYTQQGDTITYGEGLAQKRALFVGNELHLLNADNQPVEGYVLKTEAHQTEDCHH